MQLNTSAPSYKNNTFWLLTCSVFFIVFVPWLVQQGMFFDGVTYSAIARNLANGYGSFWKPHYTKTIYPIFYEHPPLVFGLQSLFFKILGDGFLTERLYTLSTALLTAAGIYLIWRLFCEKLYLRKLAWLPMMLWLLTPVVFWAYHNNLLENTLGVFTIFSVYFICKSLIKKKFGYLVIGSLLIVPAFLSKGFVGLFPMAVTVLFWLSFDNRKVPLMVVYVITSILLPLVFFYALWILIPGLQENIINYLEHQLFPSLNNERELTTGNRFSILLQLIMQLTLPLLLILILIARQYFSSQQFTYKNKREAIFFLLLGLSASLPLIVSLKQRSFYLVPAIPYFVLGISFLLAPHLLLLINKFSPRLLLWIRAISFAAMVFAAVFAVAKAGKYISRDHMLLHDVEIICETVPEGTVLSTSGELMGNWKLAAYLSRYGTLSLDNIFEHEYFLLKKTAKPDIGQEFVKMNLNLIDFNLYRRNYPPPEGKINQLREAEFGL